MTNRVLIVGINPARPQPVKKNSALGRLQRWVGELDLRTYAFTNVILTPGSYEMRRVDWQSFQQRTCGYDRVIALGGFPSDALKRIKVGHFRMPHPSGRNRLLNDKRYERKMLEECKRYLA